MILGVPNHGLGIIALNEDTSTLVTLGVCGMTTDGHTVQEWSTRLSLPQPRPGTHYLPLIKLGRVCKGSRRKTGRVEIVLSSKEAGLQSLLSTLS